MILSFKQKKVYPSFSVCMCMSVYIGAVRSWNMEEEEGISWWSGILTQVIQDIHLYIHKQSIIKLIFPRKSLHSALHILGELYLNRIAYNLHILGWEKRGTNVFLMLSYHTTWQFLILTETQHIPVWGQSWVHWGLISPRSLNNRRNQIQMVIPNQTCNMIKELNI